nr:retrotransposon protein, putative, Ty1-copia subclass [Tanacetum cinerariifolium]
MTGAKFDIEKFDETGDFGLWRIKMRVLLIQHGCEAALEPLPADMEAQMKAELNKKDHSAVILCLGNKVLRDVIGETTAAGGLAKARDFVHAKVIGQQVVHEEEVDVMATLNSKEIKERSKAKGDDGEGLYVWERTDHRDSRQSREKSRSKSQGGRLKCYIFQSEDHLKINCLKNNRKKSTGYVKKDKQPSSSGSTYDDSEVMMVMSAQSQALLDWIMDSGCSYHMTPRDNCVYSLDGHAMACELNASVEEKDSLAQVWHKRLGHISEFRCRKAHYLGSDRLCSFRHMGSVLGEMEKVQRVEAVSKNQIGRTVKKLRTDNGLEFCNREFEQLCIESGIARHLIVAGRRNKMGCIAYPYDRQGKLEPRAVKCVLLGYPEGVKGYRLYRLDDESPKIVTSRNMVFNESVMYKDTLKDSGEGDKYVEELHVEVELQRLNNHTPKKYQTDQEDGDDEDTRDQATDQPPDLTNYQLVQDKEPRTRTKPLRFRDESNMAAYAFVAAEEEDTHEPLTYQEAVACEDNSKWKATMKEEMDSLRKNMTWELVYHLAEQKLVSCKWLFKIKKGIEGVQKPRYKARLVARGFKQREGIDYNELDVKTVFLHGNLEEVIYMKQPPGYEQGNKVCLLKKSLYGLKQSHRQSYKRFDEYMMNNEFKRSSYDSCVYYRSYASGEYIYLLLYVDDMMIACKSKAEIGSNKSLLKKEFGMKELREAKNILGMEIVKDRNRKILRVSQSGYVSKILNNFRIDNGKSVKIPLGGHFKLSLNDCPIRDCDVERTSKVPYANAVGSLMYLMVFTRPNIAYAVSVVSRYLANPGKNHWEAVKWILKYLRGTTNVGLVYGTNRSNHVDVTGFVDSDYAMDPDKGRDVLEAKMVKVLKVGTEHNVVDALMKVVHGLKLQHCLELLNVGVG